MALSEQQRERLDRLTERIIGGVHEVSNELGAGFLEKVYENALAVQLRFCGLAVEQQKRLEVRFRGALVGEFVTDLVVERDVLVEVKAVRAFDDVHVAQCLNYLKATGLPVCLLVNFGTARAVIKRVVNDF